LATIGSYDPKASVPPVTIQDGDTEAVTLRFPVAVVANALVVRSNAAAARDRTVRRIEFLMMIFPLSRDNKRYKAETLYSYLLFG
jgi:hypothetical protein